MITVSNLGMQFGGQWLFQQVDLQFLPGNCYGIIGANGAGKSTFLRILTGELESTNGSVTVDPDKRVSVLKQNQNAYDDYTIMDTVIMGNQHLYDVMKEKDAIYEKEDFTDEDGIRASELEVEFAEMGGWEAESDAHGSFYIDAVALTLTQKCFTERAIITDTKFHRIGFGGGNDFIFSIFAVVDIMNHNLVTNVYFICSQLGIVKNDCIFKSFFQICNLAFDFSLFVLCFIVFAVFRKVTVCSCLLNC